MARGRTYGPDSCCIAPPTSLARGRCGCATPRGSASLRCARVLAKERPETRRAWRLVCCRWNFRLNVLATNWEDSCPCPVKSAGLKSLASNQKNDYLPRQALDKRTFIQLIRNLRRKGVSFRFVSFRFVALRFVSFRFVIGGLVLLMVWVMHSLGCFWYLLRGI